MKKCSSCGNELADTDRFCGECGAAVPAAASPPSPQASLGTLVPIRAARLRRYTVRGLAALAVLAGLLLAGGGIYYLLSDKPQRGAIVRFALGEHAAILEAAVPEETPTPEPTETETPKPEPTETTPATEVAATVPAPSATPAQTPVQPGGWAFTTQLINVTKANPADASFELNRQGIGASEAHSICMSEAGASNLRASAFPFPPGLDCRPSYMMMADGRYRSNMTCNFPQYGGRRPVDASGQYSGDNISITARVRVPAEIISGDFARTPEIYLHYRIAGRRTGGC